MTAIAAVDVALWDIKGKALNTPVYNLLGGKSRGRGVWCTRMRTERILPRRSTRCSKHMSEGYLAVRAQAGVPGVASSYGVPKGGKPYEPAERGLPSESLWSTERYLNFAPKLFEELRKTVGEDVHLLHDVHHRLTPIEAARLGKALEPYHLFWMEDPTPAEMQEGFALIRQHTTTPIATGEVFNSVWDCNELISQAVDRLHPHDDCAWRWHYACEEDGGLCGAVPGADGVSRGDGPVAGDDGGGAARWAWRFTTSESRSTCSTRS